MRATILGVLATVLCTLANPTLAQQVWLTDTEPCPQADELLLPNAVLAAADGDVIITRNDSAAFHIDVDGKSLSILANGSERLPAGDSASGWLVRNLAAGQRVVLRGFDLDATLEIRDCAGTVWIEDCTLGNPLLQLDRPGLDVRNSPNVVLQRSEVFGVADPGGDGHGLRVDGTSRVFVHDSEIFGGQSFPVSGPGLDGGHAVLVEGGGFVLLDDCLVRGGRGGKSDTCATTGDGGDGLHLQNPGSAAWLLDTTLVAGQAGLVSGGCPAGAAGSTLAGNGSANAVHLPGQPRGLSAPALAAEGETVALQLDLPPTDLPFLLVSLDVAAFPSFAFDGVLLPQLPGLLLPAPPIQAALPVTLPPDLVAPGSALPLVLQILALDGSDKRAGSATWLTVLDEAVAHLPGCITTLVVDDDAPDDPGPHDSLVSDPLEDGTPEHPYDSVAEALDVALDGWTVLVRDGSYTGTVTVRTGVSLRSENGPGSCTIFAPFGNTLVLDDCPPGTEVRGFKLRANSGNAVVDLGATPSALLANCEILQGDMGLRLDAPNGDFTLEDCLIADNSLGGVRADGSLRMTRCTVIDNGTSGASNPAVLGTPSSDLWLQDCLIARNDSLNGSGLTANGSLTAERCTIALNPSSSGGADVRLGGPAILSHCIVWGPNPAVLVKVNGDLSIDHCLLSGGLAGIQVDGTLSSVQTILDGPPAFANPANDDFHLGPTSPAIDAGDPAFVAPPGITDIDGQPRVQGAAVDLGADERP